MEEHEFEIMKAKMLRYCETVDFSRGYGQPSYYKEGVVESCMESVGYNYGGLINNFYKMWLDNYYCSMCNARTDLLYQIQKTLAAKTVHTADAVSRLKMKLQIVEEVMEALEYSRINGASCLRDFVTFSEYAEQVKRGYNINSLHTTRTAFVVIYEQFRKNPHFIKWVQQFEQLEPIIIAVLDKRCQEAVTAWRIRLDQEALAARLRDMELDRLRAIEMAERQKREQIESARVARLNEQWKGKFNFAVGNGPLHFLFSVGNGIVAGFDYKVFSYYSQRSQRHTFPENNYMSMMYQYWKRLILNLIEKDPDVDDWGREYTEQTRYARAGRLWKEGRLVPNIPATLVPARLCRVKMYGKTKWVQTHIHIQRVNKVVFYPWFNVHTTDAYDEGCNALQLYTTLLNRNDDLQKSFTHRHSHREDKKTLIREILFQSMWLICGLVDSAVESPLNKYQ